MNPKSILNALGILSKAPASEVAKILADNGLEKAAQSLADVEKVDDRWQDGEQHKPVSREEIHTGPGQSASGNGAERMIAHYSHPAPQDGVTEQALTLARLLAPVVASSKAQTEAIQALIESVKSLTAVTKSETDKEDEKGEDDEEDEEDSEVVEINASKAKSLIAQAKTLLIKAKKADAKAAMEEEEEEEEEAKACKKKARAFRKQAAVLLGKARTAAFISGSKDLRKSIRDIAAKADINVVQEDEQDEEEEDEEEGEAEKAKGNQADHANKDGNQDDVAAKAALSDIANKVDAALKGFGLLQTDVRGMLDTVAGRSKGTGTVPAFTKSEVAAPTGIPTVSQIDEMEDSGELDQSEAFAARDIIAKSNAARAGQIGAQVVTARIEQSSRKIKELFKAVQ